MDAVSNGEHRGAHPVEETLEADFPTLRRAEEAVDALGWAGIEAADLTVAGPALQAALARTDTELRDTRLVKKVVGMTTVGVLIGAVLGIFIGGIAALIIGPTVGGLEGYDRWLATGLGALLGLIIGVVVGGMIGGERALTMNVDAELEYEDIPPEPTVVHVSLENPAMAPRAESILRAKGPLRMRRFVDGRPEPLR